MSVATTQVVKNLPLNVIHVNSNFNSRGAIAPIDVVDLMRDIKENGLIQPVAVRVYDEHNKKLFGFDYGLLAGFRRYTACKLIGWETVPCVIHDHIDDIRARIINLSENLKRKNLNILLEAKALEYFKWMGYSREEIARMVDMSLGWVQIRLMLLDLAPEIQEVAAADLLSQSQIREIHSLAPNKRIDAVRAIKVARERGNSTMLITKRLNQNKNTKRIRMKKELLLLQEQIRMCIGPNVMTRLLAWCGGEISDGEFYTELRTYMKDEYGVDFAIPEHIR